MSLLRRRAVIVSVAVVLLAAGTAAAYWAYGRRDVTTSSEQAHRLYYQGLENEQKMYMREALEDYAAALAKDPHFVMATLRLAGTMSSRDPERAQSLIESAGRYRDEITERERLFLDMFEARFRKDKKGFEASVDRYLRKFPRDPEGYQMRASILARAGKVDEAAKVYQQLLAVNPNYAIAYNNLGYYAMGMKDWAKAEDNFRRYRFLAPDQANPFDSLGELYANTGRYAEARESLKQALAVKPDFAPSLAHLGTVAVGEGRLDEAAELFRQAVEAADSPEATSEWEFARVFCYLFAGDAPRAMATLTQVEEKAKRLPDAQRKPQTIRAAFVRAAIESAAGRAEEAEKHLAEAGALVPKEGEGKYDWDTTPDLVRAIAARAKGDHAKAVELFAAPLKKADEAKTGGSFPYFPMNDLLRVDAAESLVAVGRRDDAEKLLAKTLSRNPRFQPAVALASRLGLHVPEAAAGAEAVASR